ncbi:MAG: glycoside hydrolase family 3 C-terminal domain-containing protein [Lachnospiraceae bacterium]|nr:glycoside hydrolase family 3 C-terminal domain-containing protein [Lachnospiraceae bacterium]
MKQIIMAGTSAEPSALELSSRALARRAAAEGMVLLENDGILPLTPGRIALFGAGARMTVKGGTGSGVVRERYSVTIEQGLKSAGFTITSEAWLDRFDQFYADTYEAYRAEQEERVKGMQNFYQILGTVRPFQHPTGMPVEEADIAAASENGTVDTAICVLSRQAGEGNDREDIAGDYRLDETEIGNIRRLSAAFSRLIVVVNVGGLIDLSFMDEVRVSALVYMAQGGEEGGNALADVLTGARTFSGRLTTSWPVRFEDVPSAKTYSYLGGDPHNQEYTEGIYVGYRYYDTFSVKTRYPFGYGLSYTGFERKLAGISGSGLTGGDTLQAEISVRNAGNCAGRETVLLFATVPFGETGAEYRRLVAFGKTGVLAPGEETVLTLTFPVRELSVYDEDKAAWILRGGRYVLRLEETAAAVLELAETVTLEKCANLCVPQYEIGEITAPARAEEDLAGLPVCTLDAQAFRTLVHVYAEPEEETIDPLAAGMTSLQLAQLLCGGGTGNKNVQVMAMGASGTSTPDLYDTLGIPNVILSDGPAGLNLTSHLVELPDGEIKSAKVPEVLEAYKRYFFGMSKYALMSQMADPSQGTMHYQYATAWPCSQLLAQTYDPELVEAVGNAVGQEMLAYGVTVWLAPGMNIHRNPLCGRTFEYYSEDPVVSGKIAAAIVRGVQKHPGLGMSVKHFAANNCELERNASSSNLSERALREIYLRGFEIAVKESRPMTVMAAYNLINGTYCTNNHDLLVGILRNEWGFEGLVMSDWDAMKADRQDCMKAATGDVLKAHAAQCDLVMPGRPDQVEALTKGLETGAVSEHAALRSATRILKMVRQNVFLKTEAGA